MKVCTLNTIKYPFIIIFLICSFWLSSTFIFSAQKIKNEWLWNISSYATKTWKTYLSILMPNKNSHVQLIGNGWWVLGNMHLLRKMLKVSQFQHRFHKPDNQQHQGNLPVYVLDVEIMLYWWVPYLEVSSFSDFVELLRCMFKKMEEKLILLRLYFHT